MQRELKEHKEQASKIKNEYADYNRKLQDKLGELRNEKKAWMTEAADSRLHSMNLEALSRAVSNCPQRIDRLVRGHR